MCEKQPIEIINHAGLCFADWLASARGAKSLKAGSIPVRSTNGANRVYHFPFMNPYSGLCCLTARPQKGELRCGDEKRAQRKETHTPKAQTVSETGLWRRGNRFYFGKYQEEEGNMKTFHTIEECASYYNQKLTLMNLSKTVN